MAPRLAKIPDGGRQRERDSCLCVFTNLLSATRGGAQGLGAQDAPGLAAPVPSASPAVRPHHPHPETAVRCSASRLSFPMFRKETQKIFLKTCFRKERWVSGWVSGCSCSTKTFTFPEASPLEGDVPSAVRFVERSWGLSPWVARGGEPSSPWGDGGGGCCRGGAQFSKALSRFTPAKLDAASVKHLHLNRMRSIYKIFCQ